MKRILVYGAISLTFLATNVNAATKHHAGSRHQRHAVVLNTVYLNSATAAELATLKGIGKHRAQVILAYRKQHGPFHAVDDLVEIKGISQKRLQRLKKRNGNRIRLNH